MHANNFTLYQLVKYHIELTEAMEYTLITYKYDEKELLERLYFLKTDYKNGFYHRITKKLFNKSKKLTQEIKYFVNHYNKKRIDQMVNDHNLHSRIQYNNDLYLAYASSKNIIDTFLNEEEINKNLEKSLLKLIKTTNEHFILFCLFNSINLYISNKVIIMQGDTLYDINEEDKKNIKKLVNSIKDAFPKKELITQTFELMNEMKKFNEEEAYELLNKISVECSESEKKLYQDFDKFTKSLEKEIKNEIKNGN